MKHLNKTGGPTVTYSHTKMKKRFLKWLQWQLKGRNCRYIMLTFSIRTAAEAHQKLSRREAWAWEAGAHAGIRHGLDVADRFDNGVKR